MCKWSIFYLQKKKCDLNKAIKEATKRKKKKTSLHKIFISNASDAFMLAPNLVAFFLHMAVDWRLITHAVTFHFLRKKNSWFHSFWESSLYMRLKKTSFVFYMLYVFSNGGHILKRKEHQNNTDNFFLNSFVKYFHFMQ